MSEPTRALLVGCGGISRAWLRAIAEMPEVEIVGMVDLIESAARTRAEEFGLPDPLIETSLTNALAALDPQVVFNCTVPGAHRAVTLEALAHGCHVLGEKPLADSMENAREMVQAADAAERIFAVIQNRRYDPNIRRYRNLIEGGALGPMTTVDSDFYLGAHFGGFREHMEHVLLLDMAIHTFDAARLITGADPISVYCHEWNPAGSWFDQDAAAVAIFEMTDGIVYTYRGSWCAEGQNTTWECDWRVIGRNGSAIWDGAEQIEAEVVSGRTGLKSDVAELPVPQHDPGTKVGAHGGVIREFVECVRNGGAPETSASDNIKSLAMVFGAIESAETGQKVEIRI